MDAGSLVFDRYRLAERIDAGGVGEAWRAIDLILDQVVALRCIRQPAMGNEQVTRAQEGALSGARLVARLRRHPNVVATYDVRVDGADLWLVLEYVPSRSLAQILREKGPLDPGQAARIGAQVADALAAAHAMGIAHGGITPGNVLITDDGSVKLTNFGISGPADGTQPGTSGPATDVLALGSTLYAAVAGQPPFSTGNSSSVQFCVAGALSPLLVRLLDPDPTIRPDATSARALLDQFATEASAPALPPTSARLARRWWSRPRVLIAVVTLIAAVALAAGILLWPRAPDDAPQTAPLLPPKVGPIALTGDPRAADPCPLIDPAALRQFGRPFITFSYFVPGCRARIENPRGDVYLNVSFALAESEAHLPRGSHQQLGDLTIVRNGVRSTGLVTVCENALVLADRTELWIVAHGPAADLCAVTEAGTVAAVNGLTRDGIRYRPDRTSGWSHASSDACAVLDSVALSKIAGLEVGSRVPGFAHWSCTWGAIGTGGPRVSLWFQLDDVNAGSYGDLTTIAGRRAWLHPIPGVNNPQQCQAVIVHRHAPSATSATEVLRVEVDAPGSRADLCARAAELAAAAEARLPPPP